MFQAWSTYPADREEDKDGYFPSYYWHPDTKTTCDLGMGIDLNRHLQNVQDRIEKEEND
jgi:hypothetical protein